ncbi:hypothetical protein HDU79_003535 [Rhizoclosmatium sp. JEL0117]|nr:hypothetical protein HDU79_003535 [Rhizoclosmatium sp. JEL0117]
MDNLRPQPYSSSSYNFVVNIISGLCIEVALQGLAHVCSRLVQTKRQDTKFYPIASLLITCNISAIGYTISNIYFETLVGAMSCATSGFIDNLTSHLLYVSFGSGYNIADIICDAFATVTVLTVALMRFSLSSKYIQTMMVRTILRSTLVIAASCFVLYVNANVTDLMWYYVAWNTQIYVLVRMANLDVLLDLGKIRDEADSDANSGADQRRGTQEFGTLGREGKCSMNIVNRTSTVVHLDT